MENFDQILESLYDRVIEPFEAKQQINSMVINWKENELIDFLKDYQKTCQMMHVNKIDARNFVDVCRIAQVDKLSKLNENRNVIQ